MAQCVCLDAREKKIFTKKMSQFMFEFQLLLILFFEGPVRIIMMNMVHSY